MLTVLQDEARAWLTQAGPDFIEVCGLASLDPGWLKSRVHGLRQSDWRAVSAPAISSRDYPKPKGEAASSDLDEDKNLQPKDIDAMSPYS